MNIAAKALHAYQNDALDDYLMGRYPYFIEEAYMAPSNVPTNWVEAVQALGDLSATAADVPSRIETAIGRMSSSSEGVYCALETLLAYVHLRTFLPPSLCIDVPGLMTALAPALSRTDPEARTMHLEWMGPTDEVLWDRIARIHAILSQDHGI